MASDHEPSHSSMGGPYACTTATFCDTASTSKLGTPVTFTVFARKAAVHDAGGAAPKQPGHCWMAGTLGSGTVSASPEGPYAAGTQVTLTASPASGWSFSSWSGSLVGHAVSGTLIVNANDTVTATFDQNRYQGCHRRPANGDGTDLPGGVHAVARAAVAHNHLYYGHGLSIGSETNAGMGNMLATDNVINQNGCSGCSSSNDIRIKSDVSRGGEVKNVLYQDTCIRNGGSQPHEFVFNTHYTPDVSGNLVPFFHDISLHNVHMVDAGNSSTFDGFDATHILTTRWDNVALDALNSSDFGSSHTDNTTFTLGSGPVSFTATVTRDAPSDTRVTVVLEQAVIEKAAPTGTIDVLEGANVVASARISRRNGSVTIANVGAGTHTYIARYDGDSNYATLLYGSVVVTAH